MLYACQIVICENLIENFIIINLFLFDFIQENTFENVICEIASILSWAQWVNSWSHVRYGYDFKYVNVKHHLGIDIMKILT